MTYDEALGYIHGVSNFFCKPGLDRITKLCEGLGNPQNKLKFIHVGGTNGKGSFCAMTESILRSAGYKVGLFTSPYVKQFNERMRINGENIPNDILASLTEKIGAVADKMTDKPTEFELITAIAFEYFRREACDVVVLEVGMGGRFDATNIIDTSILSVITGVALDHIAFLGDTTQKIAAEKAGIIKSGVPVLFGGEDSDALAVISSRAREMGSEFYHTDYSSLSIASADLSGTNFNYKDRKNLRISLLGSYQPRNAALVIDAVNLLRRQGLKIDDDALQIGLENARWSARFEVIAKNPTVIFDGAHNAQGIEAAVESIKQYFGKQRVVVFTGVLRDKDYDAISSKISEVANAVFTITPDNPRALSAEEYADLFRVKGVPATACVSVSEALTLGKQTASEGNTALCCLGSLYTYKEVTDCLG